jgi:nucleotide-binding universal stress UspA family protein
VSRIIGRVVVGVSGSPRNLHALRHAVELARSYNATLIAVHSRPTKARNARLRRSTSPWQQEASIVVRTAFDDGLGGLPPDVDCVLLAAPGRPGPALLAIADRANDVLVLGSAHRRALRIGTRVAEYCLTHAACSVLTVPPPPLLQHPPTPDVHLLLNGRRS